MPTPYASCLCMYVYRGHVGRWGLGTKALYLQEPDEPCRSAGPRVPCHLKILNSRKYVPIFFKFILFLAVLGLRCCMRAFFSCTERGLLPSCFSLRWLLLLQSMCSAQQLWHTGLLALRHVGSSRIFPDLNPSPLHCKVDS